MNTSRMLRSAILATVILVAHAATAGSVSVVNAINNVKAGANKPKPSGKLTISGNGVSQRPATSSPVIVRPNGTVVSSAGITKTGTGSGSLILTAAGATRVYAAGATNMMAGSFDVVYGAATLNMSTAVLAANVAANLSFVYPGSGSTTSGSSSSTGSTTSTSTGSGTISGVLAGGITVGGTTSGTINTGTISGAIGTGSGALVITSGTTSIPTGVTKVGIGTFTLSNAMVLPGDLTINAGTLVLANSVKVNSVKFGSSAAIELSNAASTAEPIEVAGGVSVSDPGSAFTSGNVTDILTPAGAVFPDGTDIHVINATATGAVLTITNHSGAALVIKASTTVPNGITISRP